MGPTSNLRFVAWGICTLVATFVLAYWLSEHWTLYYALLAPFVLFPCLWLLAAKQSTSRIMIVSAAIAVGYSVPFLLQVSGRI